MCRFVYVTAERALPPLDPTPVFRLTPCEAEQAELVRSVAPGRFIICAQSWQGCGCGFCYESNAEVVASLAEIPEEETAVRATVKEWRESGMASVAALREYLIEAVRVSGPLRLYVVWAGEEGKIPQRTEVVTPGYFGGDAFLLRENELFFVSGEPSSET
jgi:hypothetical protein